MNDYHRRGSHENAESGDWLLEHIARPLAIAFLAGLAVCALVFFVMRTVYDHRKNEPIVALQPDNAANPYYETTSPDDIVCIQHLHDGEGILIHHRNGAVDWKESTK
jgi:hypothetical protein